MLSNSDVLESTLLAGIKTYEISVVGVFAQLIGSYGLEV